MEILEPSTVTQVRSFCNRRQGDPRGMTEVHFRPLHEGDEEELRQFFGSHTSETVYLRYGYSIKEMTAIRAHELVCPDGRDDFALIGLVPGDEGERFIAIGRYCREDDRGYAEVAFVVHEAFRHMGIATFLLRKLAALIAERGFSGITATVLESNQAMVRVLYEVLGPPPIMNVHCGQVTMRWPFPPRESGIHV